MGQDGKGDGWWRNVFSLLILLGAFLSLRGYRSLEGDQAYRFPILLASLDPNLYPNDPFVGSFRDFNPHRGAIAVIGALSQVLGLSLGLFLLFVSTFFLTVQGARKLAKAAWPEGGGGEGVGWVAAVLFLVTLAGNIGTNHLFEPIVLDRQLTLSLLWFGLAGLVVVPDRGLPAFALLSAIAAVIHPTFALQAVAIVIVGRLVWRWRGMDGNPSWSRTFAGMTLLGLAVLPGLWLNLQGSGVLLEGLPLEQFRLLSLELQGPQHMLPSLWRLPQWLAWGCFPVLAGLATTTGSAPSEARSRVLILLLLTMLWLLASWVGVEVVGHLRFTLFQPFRMATVCRGLCLLLIAGFLDRLWREGGTIGKTRVVLLTVALSGDWSLVVVTLAELVWWLGTLVPARLRGDWVRSACWVSAIVGGLVFLGRHDTESGHVPLLASALLAPALNLLGRGRWPSWTPGRRFRIAATCWAIPGFAMLASVWPSAMSPFPGGAPVQQWLVKRCRFTEVPVDDIERLAVWCRANTPREAIFVGPPGPKTFRLWSRRSLAFNRAGSPYLASGLGDWADRFAEHVGFVGDPAALVRAYQADRHGLERGYDRLSPARLARLANHQKADYVILPRRPDPDQAQLMAEGLCPVHEEGRYTLLEYRAGRVADSRLSKGSW